MSLLEARNNYNEDLKHVLFTCFGVGVHDHLWLFYRLEIFERVTLKSILNQYQLNNDCLFEWVIMIGEDAPILLKYKLRELLREHCFIKIIEIKKYSDRVLISRNYSKENKAKILIQSRIDDDDALVFDAFHRLRNAVVESVACGKHQGSISYKGGYDWLLEGNHIVINSSDNLAIGLSVFMTGGQQISIFDYVHDTLKNNFLNSNESTNITLDDSNKWWVYVKHSLSDSNYFGMKHRFLNQDTFEISNEFYKNFGIEHTDAEYLINLFSESPVGFPSQAIQLGLKVTDSKSSMNLNKKTMSNIIRYRIKEKEALINYKGSTAYSIYSKLINEGFLPYKEIKSHTRKYDVLIIDDIYLVNLIKNKKMTELEDILIQQELCDYLFLINTFEVEANLEVIKQEYLTFKKQLKKMQEVGGWRLEVGKEQLDLGIIVNRISAQIKLNLY